MTDRDLSIRSVGQNKNKKKSKRLNERILENNFVVVFCLKMALIFNVQSFWMHVFVTFYFQIVQLTQIRFYFWVSTFQSLEKLALVIWLVDETLEMLKLIGNANQ